MNSASGASHIVYMQPSKHFADDAERGVLPCQSLRRRECAYFKESKNVARAHIVYMQPSKHFADDAERGALPAA